MPPLKPSGLIGIPNFLHRSAIGDWLTMYIAAICASVALHYVHLVKLILSRIDDLRTFTSRSPYGRKLNLMLFQPIGNSRIVNAINLSYLSITFMLYLHKMLQFCFSRFCYASIKQPIMSIAGRDIVGLEPTE